MTRKLHETVDLGDVEAIEVACQCGVRLIYPLSHGALARLACPDCTREFKLADGRNVSAAINELRGLLSRLGEQWDGGGMLPYFVRLGIKREQP